MSAKAQALREAPSAPSTGHPRSWPALHCPLSEQLLLGLGPPQCTSVSRSPSRPTSSVMLCGILQLATTAHSPVLLETPSFGAAENQGHPKTWPALALSQQEGTSRPLDCLPDSGARSLQGPSPLPRPCCQDKSGSHGAAPCAGTESGPRACGHRGPGWEEHLQPRRAAATYWYPRVRCEQGCLKRKPQK